MVFGDIGTSPLYTVQTVFNPSDPHPVPANIDAVYGIASLIFWSVMIIVTVTYVLLVMRADNDGEGGIMALITLIQRRQLPGGRRTKLALAALGLFGASLFLGDSMITPAISVLSAVEGLKVASPSLDHLIVPITAAIIVVLFLVQRAGTAAVGRLFGPVMLVWFLVIGACGVKGIALHPEILKALSPTYAITFFVNHFTTAFFSLAAVVLAVTGAEALYADMGHFGRRPITRAWLLLVFPACILSYLGQGALILDNPHVNIASPFFLLVPDWGRWPMVFLATAATVIASQAVITGAFSVARQAVQLGYLPRLRIVQTSARTFGQIYVPWINWMLMIAVLVLIFTFESSASLAFAFGMAVTGTITITTLLFLYIVRHQSRAPLWLVVIGGGLLLGVDLLFFAANLTKLTHGAWLPLLIGLAVLHRPDHLGTRPRADHPPARRARGSAPRLRGWPPRAAPSLWSGSPAPRVFLNRTKLTTPLAMRASVDHLHALHKHAVILSIETLPVPHVPPADRLVIDDLGYTDDAITHASARFGYMDDPSVPSVLRLLEQAPIECPLEVDQASYFLSTIDLHLGDAPGLNRWRKRLFLAMAGLTTDAAEYFGLPRDRTVILGARIEI